MPKKAAPKKRTGRPVKRKKSFFESLFSFSMPKMFAIVAAAVFLTLMFQFNNTSELVLGTKTAEETFTQSQVDSLKMDTTSPSYTVPKMVRTRLMRDKNGNGIIDGSDTCLPKKYSFKLSGKMKTLTQNSDCLYLYTPNKSGNNCVEVKFENTLSNYTFTGIEYTNGQKIKNSKSKTVSVCGTYGTGESASGGYVYSQANFLLKAK